MLQALIIEGWMAQLLGLLLTAALLSARAYSKANHLLAAALLCAVYRQCLLTMQMSGMIEPSSPLLRTLFPLQMLAIPLLYLYVKGITTAKFELARRHAVHLIPFAFGVAWCFAVWIWESFLLLQRGISPDQELYFRVVVKVIVIIPYVVQVHRRVRTFANESKNQLSDLTQLKLSWLRTLLIIVYFVISVDALYVITGPAVAVWRLIPSVGLISLMALAYFSLRVSPVFTRQALWQETDSSQDEPAAVPKTETSRFSDEQLERQKVRLIDVLEKRALYLNPELRLADLATALDIRPYRVSEILSRGLQTSFYDLINRYRITQAQRLLSSPGSANLNLLGIALESGFKSKSVFNDVFKKVTGKTPSEFRIGR